MLDRISYLPAVIFILFLFSNCSGKMDVGKVNMENWKNDRNGCLGLRLADMEEFRKIKNEFLGANNQALIKTFGRPDRVELVDRSQTFFYYYLEPSSECAGTTPNDEPLKVLFRLNAISKVSEVTISHLDP